MLENIIINALDILMTSLGIFDMQFNYYYSQSLTSTPAAI